MFKIVVPSYNTARWIERTLLSIQNQTYKEYDVCVIDDASTDPEQREITEAYCKKNGWKAIFNETRKGSLHNIVQGIRILECEDEDIILVVDGDDWLFTDWALQIVLDTYDSGEVWATFGQPVIWSTGEVPMYKSPPIHRRFFRSYRSWNPWVFVQLRTFKYFLWKQIRDQDLRDKKGNYLFVTGDMAFMYPIAEMAGSRLRRLPNVLYVVNDQNPISDCKVRIKEQLRVDRQIRRLPKYAQSKWKVRPRKVMAVDRSTQWVRSIGLRRAHSFSYVGGVKQSRLPSALS